MIIEIKKPNSYELGFDVMFVGPLGLEPRLFYTKNRRVASYTMGHYLNADANLIQTLACTNIFLINIIFLV